MHGGSVDVESAGLGQGSTFRVTLPQQHDKLAYRAPLTAQASHLAMLDSAPKLSGLRALVVDDEADSRELTTTVLSMKGAEVRAAGGVTEAMNVMADWRPEIVIADIAMPDGD
jgi:PleD family two-component response regulator